MESLIHLLFSKRLNCFFGLADGWITSPCQEFSDYTHLLYEGNEEISDSLGFHEVKLCWKTEFTCKNSNVNLSWW